MLLGFAFIHSPGFLLSTWMARDQKLSILAYISTRCIFYVFKSSALGIHFVFFGIKGETKNDGMAIWFTTVFSTLHYILIIFATYFPQAGWIRTSLLRADWIFFLKGGGGKGLFDAKCSHLGRRSLILSCVLGIWAAAKNRFVCRCTFTAYDGHGATFGQGTREKTRHLFGWLLHSLFTEIPRTNSHGSWW